MMTIAETKQTEPTHHQMPERYKIIQDNEGCLVILDQETKKESIRTAEDIIFSGEFQFYSKADAVKIGFMWGRSKQLP